jgi:hypothetical protein
VQHQDAAQGIAFPPGLGRLAQGGQLFAGVAQLVAGAVGGFECDVERVGAQDELQLEAVQLVEDEANRAQQIGQRPSRTGRAAAGAAGSDRGEQVSRGDRSFGAVEGQAKARLAGLFAEPEIGRGARAQRAECLW